MNDAQPTGGQGRCSELRVLAVLAACCVGPMLLIVVLTATVGVSVGYSSAVALGVVAAGLCVVLMAQRHRHHQITREELT